MDPFHERLARVALDAAGSDGFALAGGYAVQAHGFLNRMSSDVDLFAEASGEFDFSAAVDAVISAYRRDGVGGSGRSAHCAPRAPERHVRIGECSGAPEFRTKQQ
jgi:hypothetical protein